MESRDDRELREKLANEELARALKSMKYETWIVGGDNSAVLARQAEAEKTWAAAPIVDMGAKSLKHSCPVCGKRCTSYEWSTTCLPRRREDGHVHDPNCLKFRFNCSGHSFVVRARQKCPKCDWLPEEFCHVCGNNVRVRKEEA